MKINLLKNKYTPNYITPKISYYNYKVDEKTTYDTVSFSGNKSLYEDERLKELEGKQKGIKIFEGLSLKEIAFIAKDLGAIALRQGCNSNCKHCFADARPPLKETLDTIKSTSFEDYKTLLDGFKELEKKTGINFINHDNKEKLVTLIFDADNIDIAVKDKNGQTHEFPELNRMLYETTGRKGLFDTSGWNVKSKTHQERAERIVAYYSKPENLKELYQFNISINPFHSIHAKAVELREKGEIEKAQKLYHIYLERMSNALFTFIPLLDKKEFGTIIRAFPENIARLDGFNKRETEKLLEDIDTYFIMKCLN
jgi:hypothetical protein